MFHNENPEGHVFHVYNRGVDKRRIFMQEGDYSCFLWTLQVRNEFVSRGSVGKYVSILAYCLMPNHYHLLVEELLDGGLSMFMARIGNSYTKTFNSKYRRPGRLFESRYKSVMISSDEQFIATVDYIHQNPCKSGIVSKADDYRWSSISEFQRGRAAICSDQFLIGYRSMINPTNPTLQVI